MNKFISLRPRFVRWLLAGAAALIVVPWAVAPAAASSGIFQGKVTASPPMSPPFISSPTAIDISQGPVTVVFTTKIENLTDQVISGTVDIGVAQILTYNGRNVTDGDQGKPGITFGPSDAANTTQVRYAAPRQLTLTLQPKGAAPLVVSFSTVMTTCGYFQFDMGKRNPGGAYSGLTSGFARVTGCSTGSSGTPPPTNPTPAPSPTPPPTGGTTGGTVPPTGGVSGASASSSPHGGVLAASAGVPLANTGLPIEGGLAGAIMVLIGALGLRYRRN